PPTESAGTMASRVWEKESISHRSKRFLSSFSHLKDNVQIVPFAFDIVGKDFFFAAVSEDAASSAQFAVVSAPPFVFHKCKAFFFGRGVNAR
ncbi:MAG: hypothetical protein ACI3YC_06010, partial [Alloprevotella sp.]